MDKMIVYEDNVLLVVHKPVGIATETARVGQADLVSELKNYRKRKGEAAYIGVVHRLDQPVEGLLVFAKDGGTARKLSGELQSGALTKKYVALVAGVLQTQEGKLTDYLLNFLAWGFIGLLSEWFEKDMALPKAELLAAAQRMADSASAGLFEERRTS